MAGQMARAITNEFPDYLEFKGIMDLAAVTWPRFGLSAVELSQLDNWQVEMLRVYLEWP